MCVIIITHNTNSELILIETKAKQWTEKPALKKQTQNYIHSSRSLATGGPAAHNITHLFITHSLKVGPPS